MTDLRCDPTDSNSASIAPAPPDVPGPSTLRPRRAAPLDVAEVVGDNCLPGGFDVAVGSTGTECVLRIFGEVDLLNAHELSAALDTIIEERHRTVVLDLAPLDFIGLAGLRAIADAADRVGRRGGALTIRSPSATASRILDIVGSALPIRLEQPQLVPTSPHPAGVARVPTIPVGPSFSA